MDKKTRNNAVRYLRMDYDGNWSYDKDILQTYSTKEAAVNDMKENYYPLYSKHNLPNLKVFQLVEEKTWEEYDKHEKKWEKVVSHSTIFSSVITKKDFEELNLTESDYYSNVLDTLEIPYIRLDNSKYYVKKNVNSQLKKIFETELQPFVIKGTNWPYWFKVNGKLINSDTSNWFRFLREKLNIMSENMLEAYAGPDKCDEHKRSQK